MKPEKIIKTDTENVDNTEFTCISLCSGYEGIGLAIKRVIPNMRTILYSEIEKYACEVLVQRMEEGKIDAAPIWTNLKTLPCEQFSGKVDIITGGYPCQPFSAAGQRKGENDPRHLWPWIKEIIQKIQPQYCFFENVEGHVSLGLREVLTDLVKLGYSVENDCGQPTFGLFSAAEVGAPHQRKRVFILGYLADTNGPRVTSSRHNGRMGREPQSSQELGNSQSNNQRRPSITTMHREGLKGRGSGGNMANPGSPELNRLPESEKRQQNSEAGESGVKLWPSRPGQPQHEWEEPRTVADTKCKFNRTKEGDQDQKQNSKRSTGGACRQSDGNMAHTQNPDRGAGKEAVKAHQGQRRDRSSNQSCGTMADTDKPIQSEKRWPSNGREQKPTVEVREGLGSGEKSETQPQLGRTINGLRGRVDPTANRVDRLRLCGNGVYPDTAEKAFIILMGRVINPDQAYVQPSVQLEMFD